MTAQPTALQHSLDDTPRFTLTRMTVIAVFLILLGIFIVWRTNTTLNGDVTTILTFEAGPPEQVPHIVVPSLTYLRLAGIYFFISGLFALFAPPHLSRIRTILLGIAGVVLIPSILIAGAAGNSTNLTTMLAESLRLATPIAIGAMAGIWSERSGVVNIAIEGMMLTAACFGFTTFYYMRNAFPDQHQAQLLAVGVAILSGGIISLLHAWLSITFRTDQIVSGTVINILALGMTGFIRKQTLQSIETGLSRLDTFRIPILADIPIIGEPLFNNQPIFYLMFVVIIFTHIVLFYTRWGLRMRAVGEHPHAADTLGVNVNQMRWISVFAAGMIAGLAGAWFSLEATSQFNDNMTSGAGFIALAAVIFGKWMPFGAFGAALLFGFSQAMATRLQILEVAFPVQFLQMVPYLVTIVVLAGFIGRAAGPKAAGKPYIKE